MRKQTESVRKRKSAKGMTLIECIISILVVGVTGIIMVTAATTVCKLMTETNHINNKVAVETPYGAVRDKNGITALSNAQSAANIQRYNYNPNDASDSPTPSNGETNVTFKIGSYGDVTAKRYSTESAATEAITQQNINCSTNMHADLQFYVLDP